MPALKDSFVELDPNRYQKIPPLANSYGPTFMPSLPPEPPIVIRRSPVLISSLPIISTNVDGITRQFYGGRTLPMRRLITP